jgi:hypothetical protein
VGKKSTNFPNSVSIGDLAVTEAEIGEVTTTTETVTTLNATTANITTAEITGETVGTATITNLTATLANLTEAVATQFAVADGGTFQIGPLYLEITPVAAGENPVLTANSDVGTLVGVICFAEATGTVASITSAAVDGTDATKINITGTPGAGRALILYAAPVAP